MGTILVNGCTGEAEVLPNLLVADDAGQLFELTIRAHADVVHGTGGTLQRSWEDLVAVRRSDGTERVWYSGEPVENEAPAELVQGEPEYWEVEHTLSVTGYADGMLGLHNSVNGFLGGVHGMDEPHYATIEIGTGRSLHPLERLDEDTRTRLEEAVEAEAEARQDESWPPEMPPWDELGASALVMRSREPELHTWIPCCTWAENHNLLEISVSATGLSDLTDDGQWLAPDKGYSVDVDLPDLFVGLPDDSRIHTDVTIQEPAFLLGVTWLSDPETLKLGQEAKVMAN